MKKPTIKIKPGIVNFQKSFTGDCIRQNILNRSVDDLVRSQASGVGRHGAVVRNQESGLKPNFVREAGEIVCSLLLFVFGCFCAYGVLAL